jgi:hypothetical protein
MYFTVNASRLAKWIRVASKVSDYKTPGLCKTDSAEKVSLGALTDGLYVVAANCGNEIRVKVPTTAGYYCCAVGYATVEAHMLLESLRAFPGETVEIGLKSGAVIIQDTNGPIRFITLASFETPVRLRASQERCIRSVTTKRKLLVEGLKRVTFATATKKRQHPKLVEKYGCVVLRTGRGTLRFIAGSGARFLVYDITRRHVANTRETCSFQFPTAAAVMMWNVLAGLDSDDVTIRATQDLAADGQPEHYVVESGGVLMRVYYPHLAHKYPSVNAVLRSEYPYAVTSAVADWHFPLAGMKASVAGSTGANLVHLDTDLERGAFILSPSHPFKGVRKVPFISMKINQGVERPKDLGFDCRLGHLTDMLKAGQGYETLTLNFDNQVTAQEQSKIRQWLVLVQFGTSRRQRDAARVLSVFFMGNSN